MLPCLFVLAVCCLLPALAAAQGRPDIAWMRGGIESNTLAVSYSSDGQMVAAAGNSKVKVWRASDGMLLRTFDRYRTLSLVRFSRSTDSPDVLAIYGQDSDDVNGVKLWRVADGALLLNIPFPITGVSTIDLTPDGQTLVVGKNGIKVFRVSDGALLRTISQSPFGPIGGSFVLSPDGAMASTVVNNGSGVFRPV